MATRDQCSLCIVGDGSVGKSSMIAAFRTDGFTPVYKQTIGVDFFEKQLRIRDKDSISLRIWDVGGQSINSKNLHTYLASSDVVFLVYDVTNTESYANLDDWLRKIKEYAQPKAQYLVYLCANKIDMLQNRLVTEKQHESYITDNNLAGGIYVSARTGENLVKSFYEIAAKACGSPMSEYELSAYNKVLTAHIVKVSGEDEERTAWADEIEKEDMLAMDKAAKGRDNCGCCIS